MYKNTNNDASKTMGAAINQMNVWEQRYHDITELFVLNDELLNTVETAENPEAQFALVEAVADALDESADILSEEYIGLCQAGPQRKATTAKARIEGALRKVYSALSAFEQRTRETKNGAQMVVKKIKRQLEIVVSHFIDFVVLSLDRIMQKHDVEELRIRHANIALMLHHMGQGAS